MKTKMKKETKDDKLVKKSKKKWQTSEKSNKKCKKKRNKKWQTCEKKVTNLWKIVKIKSKKVEKVTN